MNSYINPAQFVLPLSQLKILPEAQPWVCIDNKKIDCFHSLVTVVEDSDGYIVADGFYRVYTDQRNKPKGKINALVYPSFPGLSALQTATYLSCKSSCYHHRRQTNADKVRSVQLFLAIPSIAESSNENIANTLNMSTRLVAEGRALYEQGLADPQNPTATIVAVTPKRKRVCRDRKAKNP